MPGFSGNVEQQRWMQHEISAPRISCTISVVKNLTITVEDNVLEWARVEAARRGTSVSRMVGDFMAEMMQREDAYERAYLAWRTDERSWQGATSPENSSKTEACNAIPISSRSSKAVKSGNVA